MIKKEMPVPKVTIRTVCFCSNKRHIGYCEIQEGSQWSAGAFEECINMKKKRSSDFVWWARNNSIVQMNHVALAVRGAEGVLLKKNKIKSFPHWIMLSWSNNIISKQVENKFICHFCNGIVFSCVQKTPQQCLLARFGNSELSLAVLSNFLLKSMIFIPKGCLVK